MFVPCGPQSARCDHPGALRLQSRPLLRLFSFPGVLTLWPAALARHREPFSTFSGSAPSLQSPCFRPQALSAGGTRPGTQTVAPGLLRIHPPPPLQKKKASGDSRERCAARPRLRCCSVGGLARPGERRGVEAAGERSIERFCLRSHVQAEWLLLRDLPACSFLFEKHSFSPAPPGPRPRGGM